MSRASAELRKIAKDWNDAAKHRKAMVAEAGMIAAVAAWLIVCVAIVKYGNILMGGGI